MRTESGRPQVYVTNFPSASSKWQASSEGGAYPKWSKDGKQLYLMTDGKLQVVEFRGIGTPEFSAPRTLAGIIDPIRFVPLTTSYAVAADGRIITAKRVADVPSNPIHIMTQWTKLLPR